MSLYSVKVSLKLRAGVAQRPIFAAILSGQTGTSPAINRYAAKGSLHE